MNESKIIKLSPNIMKQNLLGQHTNRHKTLSLIKNQIKIRKKNGAAFLLTSLGSAAISSIIYGSDCHYFKFNRFLTSLTPWVL